MKTVFPKSFGAGIGLLVFSVWSVAAELPTLRILNWSEYIDVDPNTDEALPIAQRSPTLREFQKLFNCKIEYSEFETDKEALRLLAQTPGYYDIIIIDGDSAEGLIGADLAFAPKTERIPNYKYIDPVLLKTFGGGGVPYLYGSTGILYRKDKYPQGIRSWNQFYDPAKPYPVSVFAEPRSAFAQALVAMGADPVNPSEQDIRAAAKFLKASVDSERIRLVTSDIELIQESVLNGDVGAAVIYSGDALTVLDEHENVGFALPDEGFEIFLDCMLLAKGSSNPDLAYSFINHVLSPEVHARLARELFYACPNERSLEILETTAPDQLSNPAIYPKAEQRSRGYPLVLEDALVDRLGKILFKM
ncbi:MAG: ABC transporter substrate-binding protein [Opitutales bacterium]